jgi:hypothetical protein
MASKVRRASAKAGANPLFSLLIIGIVLIGGFFAGRALGWWGAVAPTPTPTPTGDVDYFTFTVYVDGNTDPDVALDTFNVTEYRYDYSEVDEADLEDTLADLLYADFTAETTVEADDDDEFDVEAETIQVFKIDAWDDYGNYGYKWILTPALGENVVYLLNSSSDMNLIAFETDGGSSTLNQTNDRYWTVNWIATTTDTEFVHGWDSSNFDFENDLFNYVAVKFTLNTTASRAYASCGSELEEIADGVYLIYYFSADLFSDVMQSADFVFSTGLGTTYEIEQVDVCYGNVDGTLTSYDSQN